MCGSFPGLLIGRTAVHSGSLQQPQHVPKAPAGPWGRPELFRIKREKPTSIDMKVLKGIMCFILSAEWLGDDDDDAVERATDPLHCPGIERFLSSVNRSSWYPWPTLARSEPTRMASAGSLRTLAPHAHHLAARRASDRGEPTPERGVIPSERRLSREEHLVAQGVFRVEPPISHYGA